MGVYHGPNHFITLSFPTPSFQSKMAAQPPKTNALRKTTKDLQHIVDYEKESFDAIYADRQQKLKQDKRAVVEAETHVAKRLASHKLQKANLKFKLAEADTAIEEAAMSLRSRVKHAGRPNQHACAGEGDPQAA
ncbi:hypothetical protein OROHE_016160 [Orobanche hederae]